ncbi:MAG: hypothetical protein ACK559_01975, partial [bacterium]
GERGREQDRATAGNHEERPQAAGAGRKPAEHVAGLEQVVRAREQEDDRDRQGQRQRRGEGRRHGDESRERGAEAGAGRQDGERGPGVQVCRGHGLNEGGRAPRGG